MKIKGFTLIELLIVIAIIGIVAAIAIPNLLTALHKGKLKATMGDMKSIGTAIESYITDTAMAPGGGSVSDIEGLSVDLEPFYIKVLPTRDAWNVMLRYQSGVSGPQQSYYSIISYGRDGVFTGINIADTNYLINSLSGFNNDICFSDGLFTYAPKIK
jgi:prepilin-type N-terminal cleavage/methylation domain-containing protein